MSLEPLICSNKHTDVPLVINLVDMNVVEKRETHKKINKIKLHAVIVNRHNEKN
jgi:hypothetical protein